MGKCSITSRISINAFDKDLDRSIGFRFFLAHNVRFLVIKVSRGKKVFGVQYQIA